MAGKRILLLGGGGHCRSVLDCLLSMEVYDRIGIVDSQLSASALGVDVIGTDDDLPLLRKEGWTDAFITLGSIGSTDRRRMLYFKVKELGFAVPCIHDPSAIIARGVSIQDGVFVGKRAVINTGSRIGRGAIINTGAVIEHDCSVGDFVHVSPGATLCGQVIIGSDSHIGAGSVIRQGITVGCRTLIGVGSVVVKNVPDHVKAYGNPCREVE